MTAIVTVLIGAGVLFIASALECQPLVSTFQKIISNQTIDWSGASGCSGTSGSTSGSTTSTSTSGSASQTTAPNALGQCPPGYYQGADGQCHVNTSTAGK